MEEKNATEKLKEALFYVKKTAYETMSPEMRKDAEDYSKEYGEFLFNAKTERQAVKASTAILEKKGFIPYTLGDKLSVGGKYYLNNRSKSLFAFKIGSDSINEGVRICASHIDSPRLDLKSCPLYEDGDFAYLKTHYYGGLRKYQWVSVPLALCGVVCKSDGEKIDVNIGEDEGDPVFVIPDLLPHLGHEQGKKPLDEAFKGEVLNILVGTAPYTENGNAVKVEGSVKLNILSILHDKYGIDESDFMCAELCAVPAGHPCDVGLDRTLMGGYGHDDKVCAYPALRALTDTDTAHTVLCVLADKEETGSDGISGM